jgi:hypothetical protein
MGASGPRCGHPCGPAVLIRRRYNRCVYKAIHCKTGEEIISLSPEWRQRLLDLRALDRQDLLVCQSCRQALRLKAGRRRRPHFAHKHLKGCSYGEESAAVVEARGALYERLVELFPGAVELEKPLPAGELPRAVDVWVNASQGSFALWVVDTTLKLEARERIHAAFDEAGVGVVWVLCARMLHPDPKSPSWIRLSPTERDFFRRTPYDEIGLESHIADEEFGHSLHYLDADLGMLVSFRSLKRVHAPNLFAGRKEQHPLAQVIVNPLAPDLVHPGEEPRLRLSRGERGRRSERIRRFLAPISTNGQSLLVPIAANQLEGPARSSDEARRRWLDEGKTPPPPVESAQPHPASREAVCIHCGQLTEDWWQAWWEGETRYGKCRSCLEKGLE